MVAPIRPSPLQRGRDSPLQAGRERGRQSIEDARQHALFILEDVLVPEAQHAKALRIQISIAFRVIFILGMLSAVSLDDQPTLRAHEIGNVAIDRQLALEFVAGKSLRTENLPKPMFG